MAAAQLLGLFLPLMGTLAFALPLADMVTSRKKVLGVIALAASVLALVTSAAVFIEVYHGGAPLIYKFGGWPPHFGINYEVDGLNALLGLFTSAVMLCIVLYSLWYGRHLDEPVWYYVLLIGLEIGMLGCLYTGDAFNLFVMLEVLGISAYGLVAYHKDRAEAVEAAAKYALIGALATITYFTSVVILYAVFGTVNMGLLSWISANSTYASVKYAALFSVALATWAFTFKSALFPNHFWLPDAHPEAPTPVSAALSGLLVNIGVYAFIRFFYTLFGPGSVLGELRLAILVIVFILGAVSGVVGALMMMIQRDIKRLLAYSTISHIGIAYMGASAGFLANGEYVTLIMSGALVHIVAHGIAKAVLFMASGVLIDAAGTRDLDKMKGVGRHYPLTSLAMVISFFSLAGFLPLLGFYSKLIITWGYLESGFGIAALLIILISALSVPGYFKAIYAAIFATGGEHKMKVDERGVGAMLLAMSLSLLVLGVAYTLIQRVFFDAAASVTTSAGVNKYITHVLEEIRRSLSSLP